MFKTDLHVHTSEVSMCADIGAVTAVRLYKEAGFDGIVITNHYHSLFFESRRENAWEDNVDQLLRGYRIAKGEGDKVGLKVFCGMELSFYGENRNDYLIYGITRDFLVGYPYLCDICLADFRKIADENGLMIFQAHPFRRWMTMMPPKMLDGIETFNGHARHKSYNPAVELYAELNGFKHIAGSDCHDITNVGTSGIMTEHPVATDEELVDVIRSQDFEIYRK